jgi:N-acetylmuramoyl-L-alanine amidase
MFPKSLVWRSVGLVIVVSLLVLTMVAISSAPTRTDSGASVKTPHIGNPSPTADSVMPFGGAPLGPTAVTGAKSPVVGMVATPDGHGYWLVASDGGVFTFGDAGFFGSEGGHQVNQPIVGMATTPDGKGYWLVAADGGIFTFGDAPFLGSEGGTKLVAPIVGMAATPDGKGYWLAAADGGIFTFGDAGFFGSDGGAQLAAPAVGLAATPDGRGYWLVFGSQQRVLAGRIVGIDPGHNGLNYSAPQTINQIVFNGREDEACDTTGTATDSGYTEAQYNFNVASYLQADLAAEGAQVVITRPNNSGVGPCVTTRAAILNDAHADVAVDIHADGGPAGGRGFTVLEPVADGPNNAVIAPSLAFATVLRNTFLADTGMPLSTYDGVDGLEPRDDLAGLNLTTVPKVLIETGNMRNATDAALLITPAFQQSAAEAMAQAITLYLTGHAA